jgi:hypothetical protein
MHDKELDCSDSSIALNLSTFLVASFYIPEAETRVQQVLDQAPFLIGAGFFERVADQTREVGQLRRIVDALAANCAANRACVDNLTAGMGKMAVDVGDNKSEITRVEQKTKMGIADNKSEIAQLQTQMKHLQ